MALYLRHRFFRFGLGVSYRGGLDLITLGGVYQTGSRPSQGLFTTQENETNISGKPNWAKANGLQL